MTLIEQARQVTLRRTVSESNVTEEVFELAYAWAIGEVRLGQAQRVLGKSAAASKWLILSALAWGVSTGRLVRADRQK